MSLTRWLVTLLSFAAAVGASVYIVASSWPAEGASVGLSYGAHALAALAVLFEILARAGKIKLSALALRIPLGFGAATRTCLGGDFGAAITPARSGGEPARYLVLTEARVAPAGRLLILFTELFLEMLSLAVVATVLALVFRNAGTALGGLVGLVGGYATFVLGIGTAGVALARGNAHGPPPRWAAAVGLHAGRWRTVQRSLRQLRSSVTAVRHARLGTMSLALGASVLHISSRCLVLPALVFASDAGLPLTLETLSPIVIWPLALVYGGAVVPAPGGGGVIETAFHHTLRSAIPASVFGASLVWWRFYTFYVYIVLGALAAGGTVLRALRTRPDEGGQQAARHAARHAGGRARAGTGIAEREPLP
jgi:uncharacterized membrane protein YbhN (UPF0104 family)